MKLCPFCGAQLNDNARFCLCCMMSLDEKKPWPAPHRQSKRWQVILAAAFVFAVAFGCFLLIPPPESSVSINVPTDKDNNTTHENFETSISLFDTTTSVTPSASATSSVISSTTTTPAKRTVTLPKTTTSMTLTKTNAPLTSTTLMGINKTTTSRKTSDPTESTSTASKRTGTTTTSKYTKTTAITQKATTTTRKTTTTVPTVSRTTQKPTTTTIKFTTQITQGATTTKQIYNRTDSSVILPLPPNFPQPGERYYTRYQSDNFRPSYYEEIKDLYVEIVDIVCYQNGDAIFLEWTLGTPTSKYYCDAFLPLVHCPPNAGPHGSIFFLTSNTKFTSDCNFTGYVNIPINYDYNFYMNNPDHRFAVGEDYLVMFSLIE